MPGLSNVSLRNIILSVFGCLIILAIGYQAIALGATLIGVVTDNTGKPVPNAVISAMPSSGPSKRPDNAPQVVIDQVDKEFIDYVTPIQVGTVVTFPNNDKIRHHVYSFSPAKVFELPLYPPGAHAENKVIFDNPGEVVIGCNIHDWMKAYIYVVETPWFGRTDASGKAVITGIAPGEYELGVWHPNIDRQLAQAQKRKVKIAADKNAEADFRVVITQDWRSRRAPFSTGGGGFYR
ncbi:MAG: hypothetical protein HQK89_02760 [Nitrospirae bacterium]|nr:hypothetical protein [Nitrospirota bacterium]